MLYYSLHLVYLFIFGSLAFHLKNCSQWPLLSRNFRDINFHNFTIWVFNYYNYFSVLLNYDHGMIILGGNLLLNRLIRQYNFVGAVDKIVVCQVKTILGIQRIHFVLHGLRGFLNQGLT